MRHSNTGLSNTVGLVLSALAIVGCAHAPRPTLGLPEARTEFEAPLLAIEAAGSTVCALGYAQHVQCARADRAHHIVHDVAGTEDAVTLAVSRDRGCVATGAGEVLCFAVHDGNASRAVQVAGIDDAAEVALADDLACARHFDGDVVCWSDTRAPRPVQHVSDASSIVAVADGACALLESGHVSCWDASLEAREVSGVEDAIALGAGDDGTMAIGADGTLYGIYAYFGSAVLPAIALASVPGAVDLTVGDHGGCVRRAFGAPVCWSAEAWELAPLGSFDGAASLAVGDGYACALRGSTVRCDALGALGSASL